MYDNPASELLSDKFGQFETCMHLKIYVENEELRIKYIEAAKKHNENMTKNEYPDAGFDIFVPEDYICISDLVTKINFGIKCSASRMNWTHPNFIRHTGYYMYPRSSLSKTQLRLANSVGIIDSGYRGNLIGAFDCLSKKGEYKVLKNDRLVQICSPDLAPIVVEIVDTEEKLGNKTSRGQGGFGSTGV